MCGAVLQAAVAVYATEKWLWRLAGPLMVSNEVAYFATVHSNTCSFWSRLFSNFTVFQRLHFSFATYHETYRYSL